MASAPLVLIGGTLCDDRLWAPMLEGWRGDTVSLTVGQHAESPAPGTMQDHAAEVLARLPPRASLVGFSLGGLLALELVAQAPDRFDRLTLVCAGAGPETEAGAAARRAGEAAAEARGMAAHVRDDLIPRYGLRDVDGAVARTLIDMAVTLGTDAYRRQNDLAVSRADSRPRLGALTMPVLLVSGEHDALCPPMRHREVADSIPDVRMRVVAGCGHILPLEAPDILRGLLVDLPKT